MLSLGHREIREDAGVMRPEHLYPTRGLDCPYSFGLAVQLRFIHPVKGGRGRRNLPRRAVGYCICRIRSSLFARMQVVEMLLHDVWLLHQLKFLGIVFTHVLCVRWSNAHE